MVSLHTAVVLETLKSSPESGASEISGSEPSGSGGVTGRSGKRGCADSSRVKGKTRTGGAERRERRERRGRRRDTAWRWRG